MAAHVVEPAVGGAVADEDRGACRAAVRVAELVGDAPELARDLGVEDDQRRGRRARMRAGLQGERTGGDGLLLGDEHIRCTPHRERQRLEPAALRGDLREAQKSHWAPIDLVSALVQDELTRRQDRLLERRIKQVRFRDRGKSPTPATSLERATEYKRCSRPASGWPFRLLGRLCGRSYATVMDHRATAVSTRCGDWHHPATLSAKFDLAGCAQSAGRSVVDLDATDREHRAWDRTCAVAPQMV